MTQVGDCLVDFIYSGDSVIAFAMPVRPGKVDFGPEKMVVGLPFYRIRSHLQGEQEFMTPRQRADAIAEIVGKIALRVLEKRQSINAGEEAERGDSHEEK